VECNRQWVRGQHRRSRRGIGMVRPSAAQGVRVGKLHESASESSTLGRPAWIDWLVGWVGGSQVRAGQGGQPVSQSSPAARIPVDSCQCRRWRPQTANSKLKAHDAAGLRELPDQTAAPVVLGRSIGRHKSSSAIRSEGEE
jgi:hypothetical protein